MQPVAAIVDYGSGNLRSVAKALERVSAATGHQVCVTSDPREVADAHHIVLPGVGAFGDCVRGLDALPGMIAMLEKRVLREGVPLLGICVGMQMLLERGFEHGEHRGLGWIKGEVVPLGVASDEWRVAGEEGKPYSSLTTRHPPLKIPHMGWNELELPAVPHLLFSGLSNGDHAYFVHGYHARCTDCGEVLATVDYGGKIAAAIGRGNILGTQFHPEKSQAMGLKLLANFLRMQ